MRYIILSLIFFTLIGCNEDTTKEPQKPVIMQPSKEKEVPPVSITKKIGIDISNDKISIDLNKTKSFFNALGKTLEKKANEVQEKIEHDDGNFSENVGVVISDEKIDIDMKKASSFLDNIFNEITTIAEETLKEIAQ